ncbi:MAG TPA: ABC transporter permease [Acidimicrobiales bacterium]|nr:ABC transporter permease [Acidimicrobiales bacterium]
MSQALRVAWYRFRATLGRRWGGYLSVALLIGLTGGVAMASIEAGRRTQSSYPTFLASTNPSDLTVSVFNPGTGGPGTDLTAKIAHLAGVNRVVTLLRVPFFPLAANGAVRVDAAAQLSMAGSLDGMLTDQDRVTAVQGRQADPNRANEIVMDVAAAQLLGVHVGQVVPFGLYTAAQQNLPGFGTRSVVPRLEVSARLVGIVVLNTELVQDDIDRTYGVIMATPALIREAATVVPTATPTQYGLQLDYGGGDVPAVERGVFGLVPRGLTAEFHVTSRVVTEVELAVKPESVALGGFGAIAAAICLALGAQAVSRQLRFADEERQVMRALGAGPAAAAGDGLLGLLGGVVLGSLLAVGVAVGLSPLSPLGPVRPVYPGTGVAFDWTVLGVGLAVLVGVLGAIALVLSYRAAPHRVALTRPAAARSSTIARNAESAGLPVAAVAGVRFALEPGRGRTAVPVRSALFGDALAVAMVVATLTFASSLGTLVSHPALYGWNWSYALDPSNDVPPQALGLLRHDPDVAGWSGVDYNNVEIDGQTVPVIFGTPRAEVSPPVLSGHGLDANDQIVIGAATLAVLHKHVGDSVSVSYGTPAGAPIYIPPTRLVIVGTATFPAVGFISIVADHTSMGTGALLSEGVIPPTFQRATQSPDPNLNGPELVFVRLRNGVSAKAGQADMQRIASIANRVFGADPNAGGNYVTVLDVQRPAQIVNYRSIGSTPVVLAAGLAAGAIVALALTLVASVRRRRRDLALLKALGFTPRQLIAAVACQATVAAVVGIIVGIPLGIVIGRQLWALFAHNLNAVADPTVPVLSVLLVGIGALVFANLVAALPGRIAANTPTGLILRTE